MKLTLDEFAVRSEDVQILLDSPLNDPELVKRAEPVLRGRTFRLAKAKSEEVQDLPLTCYFDSDFYRVCNPDVASAGLHPYLHFLRYGFEEGRNPHPLIDIDLIRSTLSSSDNPLTLEGLADALENGQVRPHRYFDSDYYLAAHPDVRASGMTALRHYIRHGAAEGRSPHPDYDHERYLASVPDAPNGYYEAFLHCIAHQPASGGLPVSDGSPASVMRSVAVPTHAGTGSPPRTKGAPAGIQGWLDSVVNGIACGWVYDPQQPFKRLEVEILEGTQVVGRGTAGLHRGDLQHGGYGDGRCAFAIKLSNALSDGRSHVLTARVTDPEGIALNGEQTHQARAVSPAFDMVPSWEVAELCKRWSRGWKDRGLALEFVSAVERYSLLLETDQEEAGLRGLQSIAERNGSYELIHIKIGEAHLALNAPEHALEAYKRALKGDSLGDWALLGMGNCHRLLGKWEDAKDCYMRGLALSPVSAPHGLRMRELEDRARALSTRRFLAEGDTRSALHALVPALAARPEDPRLKDLVCEVLDVEWEQAGGGQALQLDAEMTRARRSLALLKAVLDHHADSAGERT